ncbi:MAG: arsenite methyltransferase [Anaerolineae bacterium]|nr:arsenite methyltransferase [Anaerolineae bacterium]
MDDRQIKEAVRETYGELARRFQDAGATAGCGCGSSGCGDSQAIGLYGLEEVAALPDTIASASLGCGNPLALASLKEGETVLDLGSGGGLDCFLAARRVGPTGRVIGLDMTPDMLALARGNAAHLGLSNVEFRQGEMEAIPLADATVDVIISNCVINLSPDKDAVFREAFRALRSGGRFSVSDIVTSRPLPEIVRQNLRAWSGCVGGALELTAYVEKMRAAGFERIEIDRQGGDGCCGDGLAFSARITAFKPSAPAE